MRLHFLFSLFMTVLTVLSVCPAANAWDLPDKVWVNQSMPPKYWQKAGGLEQSGHHSLQRYELFSPGGMSLHTMRMAVVWPSTDKFCVEVLPRNHHPGNLPKDCTRPVPERAVHMEVTSFLYNQSSLK